MYISNGGKVESYNEPFSHYVHMFAWLCFVRNAFSSTQKADTNLHLKYLLMTKKRKRKIY